MTVLTSAPPSFILTDENGVLVGSSGVTSLLPTSGASDGDVLAVQADGSLAFESPVVTESLTDLNEWDTDTLVIPGNLTVRQSGGVAGTDEIQIYHDGSNAYIDSQSGDLYLSSLGASGPKVTADGKLTWDKGTSSVFLGNVNASADGGNVVIGHNARNYQYSVVAIGASAEANRSGVAVGSNAKAPQVESVAIGGGTTANNYSTAIGTGATAYMYSVVIGRGATSNAQKQLVIGADGYNINDVYIGDGVTNAAPENTTYHATGGSGTDIAGASLYLAGGKGTGSGAGGDVIIQHAPAGASGTSLNSLVDVVKVDSQGLTVLQPGGVAGTDEIQIYHDGTDAYIAPQSGDLRIPDDDIYFYAGDNLRFKTTGHQTFIESISGYARLQVYHNGSDGIRLATNGGIRFANTSNQEMATLSLSGFDATFQSNTNGSLTLRIPQPSNANQGGNELAIIGQHGTSNVAPAAIVGGDVTITAGDGAPNATGNAHGGDIILTPGLAYDTGEDGIVAIRESSGVDVAQFDGDTTAGNTRFLIYDVDTASLQRVSVGAADSGGAGYRLLRIPN